MSYILVIDDDPQHRTMLQSLLRLDGHDVAVLDNGERALASCRQRLPQLVVLDILMPEKDGIETAIELRAAFPGLKILAISGGRRTLTSDFNLESAALVGANATLAKPFTRSELLASVTPLLAR